MKCAKCGNNYQVDGKGKLFCPTCNSSNKKRLKIVAINYNEITFYKVVDSENISTDTYLMEEEVDKLIHDNVEVKITR